MEAKPNRARPLPADERRRAIVEAVIPLLLDQGPTVTSREMAEAAGVAEGTIFRVFPDKPSIVVEAVKVGMDPAPVQDALSMIPRSVPMERRLEEAARILIGRSERVAALIGILHIVKARGSGRPSAARRFVTDSNAVVLAALTDLFEHHREQLRVTPAQAAVTFRGFVFANVHPMVAPDDRATPEEIVDMLLHGIGAGV